MDTLIEARGLGRRFGRTVAVSDIDLCVAPGHILALLGPNGAGKTTTLQMLAALLTPTRGSAMVAGFDVCRDADAVRAHVGIMLDEPGFYQEMRVDDYLLFFARLYGIGYDRARPRLNDLLERLGLSDKSAARLDTLSKGMRQKVSLTRALLHRPEVLLLDEPTSALDPLSARAVHRFIDERRRAGAAIILSTHNLLEAEHLADHIAIMARGRLRRLGTPAELQQAHGGQLFALTLGGSPDGHVAALAALDLDQMTVSATGPDDHTITYRTATPRETNATVVAAMVGRGASIVSLVPQPRALSDVYLETMEEAEDADDSNVDHRAARDE